VGEVFPRDMLASPRETVARVSEAITELSQAGLLWRYEVDGTRFLYLSWWESVQRIDKPGKGRFPRPDGTLNYGDSKIRESVAKSRESLAPGTGEQGNRGTEELTHLGKASLVSNAREIEAAQSEPEPDEPRGSGRSATRGAELVRAVIPANHPAAVRTELRLQANALIKAGHDPADVEAALRLWLTKTGIGARLLPTLLSDVLKTRAAPPRNGADRKGNDYLRLAAELDPANNTGLEALQ
ncbi:MAG: hypothetical protein ABFC80_10110, partial [Coriobacteriales bacterium]